MALACLSASAQIDSKPTDVPKTQSKALNMPQSQRSFQAVAPRQDLTLRRVPTGGELAIDPAKVKPVTRAQRASMAAKSAIQNHSEVLGKGKVQNRKMVNLQPTLTLNPQSSTRAKAARKAPVFAKKYTGSGLDYESEETAQWTMTPSTATVEDEETGKEKEIDVLVNVIPVPDFLSELYPNGFPVEYAIGEDDTITIQPQSIAYYEDEDLNATVYVTLFSANSDKEDGSISMTVNKSGKLSVIDGDMICIGEFAGVEFDPDVIDSEAYLGWDKLYANVSYYYYLKTTIEQTYNAHGISYFANEAVDWVMQRGTTVKDDEEFHFFVDMTPLIETFTGIYPDGIDVEYTQVGNTITVEPQVIASISGDEESDTEYIMLFSYTSDDGSIVLTEDKMGLLTIDDESIALGAWSTKDFDPTFGTFLGSYIIVDKPKFRSPDAPAEAPKDVYCEPKELVLFAGLGYSGYSFNSNLAVMGAYAPTTFRNSTMDIATSFKWTATEYINDDETVITSKDRNFVLNTKGDAVYEDFSLTAFNQKEASEPYYWGTGNCLNNEGEIRYDAIYAYAGKGASSFQFSDGTYAVMTRQNPDYDLTFYVNWATPDIAANYSVSSMSTIYSYQGKPATPLYLTGVTLPMVSFDAHDDFNLHIKIRKCTRDARGGLTLGDVIAEGDATLENVVDEYDAGVTAVEFTELYIEDEFGMSETVDYLFIEDEFVIVIEDWDNGTFSGVLGSQQYNFNEITSTWFERTGEEGRLRYYGGGWPMLFIGLLDATYGYLYTEDDTNLIFDKDGGTSSIHVDPMYYSTDEETEEPTYRLYTESVIEDGEEVEEIPEWLSFEVANEDYTTATEVDEDGEEYEYFVNGIDYDLVVNVEPLPEGVENRTAKVVFFQEGARLTVTITQDIDPNGISTIVEKTPIKNSRAYNLAGQPVGKNFKGVVVKDGKKVLVK